MTERKERECYKEEGKPHRKMDYKPIIIVIRLEYNNIFVAITVLIISCQQRDYFHRLAHGFPLSLNIRKSSIV